MRNTIIFDRNKTDENEIIQLLEGYEGVTGVRYNDQLSTATVHFGCESEEVLEEISRNEIVEAVVPEGSIEVSPLSKKISFPTKKLLVDGNETFLRTKNADNFPSSEEFAQTSGTDFLSISHLIQTQINVDDNRPIGVSEAWLHGSDVATATKDIVYESNYNGSDIDILVYEVPGSSDDDFDKFPWDHPNWRNTQGESRVKKVNWLNYNENISFGPRRPSSGENTDGQTTRRIALNQIDYPDESNSYEHCLGSMSAAGGTYTGFAKDANLYMFTAHFTSLETLEEIYITILNWHNSKPVNPKTGRINPTVLTESWGFTALPFNIFTRVTKAFPAKIVNVDDVKRVNFGNQTINRPEEGWGNDYSALTDAGVSILKTAAWVSGSSSLSPIRPFNWGMITYPYNSAIASYISVGEAMKGDLYSAGIYQFMAAGNDSQVISKNGEENNYQVTLDVGATYLNIPFDTLSPSGETVNTDEDLVTTTTEESFPLARDWPINNSPYVCTVAAATPNTSSGIRDLDSYSNRGPGIDLVGLGESTYFAAEQDLYNNTFEDKDGWFWGTGMNGTSAACPNVAGIAAVLLDYLWDRGKTQPSFEDLKVFMQNQSPNYLSSSYRSRDWSNVNLNEQTLKFPPGIIAPDRYTLYTTTNAWPEMLGLKTISSNEFRVARRVLNAQETAGTIPGLLSLNDSVRLYKAVTTGEDGEIIIIEEDEEDSLLFNTTRKVDPLVEPEEQRFYFGLATRNSLSDTRDRKESLKNIGLFYEDLNVIRGVRDLGLNRDDLHTIALLDFDAVRTLTSINSSIESTIDGISLDVDRVYFDYKIAADTKVTAESFKYKYYDYLTSTYKFADVSSSRTSSWSSFLTEEDNPPIYYGGNLEVAKDPSDNSSKVNVSNLLTESAPVRRRYAAEVPTHTITLNIDGVSRNFYAMRGIPLTFKGYFRNLAPNQIAHKIVKATEDDPNPTWTIRSLDDVNTFFEFEDVDEETFIRYFDFRTREREVKFYYDPDKIEDLFVKNIKFRDFPQVTMNNLKTLEINNNDMITTPDLSFYTPNLLNLDISSQNLMRSKDYIFANDQIQLLPDTLQVLNIDACYSSPNFLENDLPKVIDFSHMVNLKELYFNASVDLKIGIYDGTPIVYEDYSGNATVPVTQAEPGVAYEIVNKGNTDFQDPNFIKNSDLEQVSDGITETLSDGIFPQIPDSALYEDPHSGSTSSSETGSFQFGKIIKQTDDYVAVLARVHVINPLIGKFTGLPSLSTRTTNRSEVWVYEKTDLTAPRFKWIPNFSVQEDFLGDTFAYDILDTYIHDIDISNDMLVASVMTKVQLKSQFEEYIIDHHPGGQEVSGGGENAEEFRLVASINGVGSIRTPVMTIADGELIGDGRFPPQVIGCFGPDKIKEGTGASIGILVSGIPNGETLTWTIEHSELGFGPGSGTQEYIVSSGQTTPFSSPEGRDEGLAFVTIQPRNDGINESLEYGKLTVQYTDSNDRITSATHEFRVFDSDADMDPFTQNDVTPQGLGMRIQTVDNKLGEKNGVNLVYSYWLQVDTGTATQFSVEHIDTEDADFSNIASYDVDQDGNIQLGANIGGIQYSIGRARHDIAAVDDGSGSDPINGIRERKFGGRFNYPFSNELNWPTFNADDEFNPGVGYADYASPTKPLYFEGSVLVLESLNRSGEITGWTGQPITVEDVYQDFSAALLKDPESPWRNSTEFLDQIRTYKYNRSGEVKEFKTPTAFGASVALSDNNIYVGSPELKFLWAASSKRSKGAVSIFRKADRVRVATFAGDNTVGSLGIRGGISTFDMNVITRGYVDYYSGGKFADNVIDLIRRDSLGSGFITGYHSFGGHERFFYNALPMQDYTYGSCIRVTNDDKFFVNCPLSQTYVPGAEQQIIQIDLNNLDVRPGVSGDIPGGLGYSYNTSDAVKQDLLDAGFLSGNTKINNIYYRVKNIKSDETTDKGTMNFPSGPFTTREMCDYLGVTVFDNDLDLINNQGYNRVGLEDWIISSKNFAGFGKSGFSISGDKLLVGHSCRGQFHYYDIPDVLDTYNTKLLNVPVVTVTGPDRRSFSGSTTNNSQVNAYQRRFGWNPSINDKYFSTIYTDPNISLELKNANDTSILKIARSSTPGVDPARNFFKINHADTEGSDTISKVPFYEYQYHDSSSKDFPLLFSETEGSLLLDNSTDDIVYVSAVHLKSTSALSGQDAVDTGALFVAETDPNIITQLVDLNVGDVFTAKQAGTGTGTIKRVINANNFETLEFTGHTHGFLDSSGVVDRTIHSSVERSENLNYIDISRCDISESSNGPAKDIQFESETVSEIITTLNKHAFINISNKQSLRNYEQANKTGFTRRSDLPNRFNAWFAHDLSENDYLSNVNSLENLQVSNTGVWGNIGNCLQSLTSVRDLQFVNTMLYGNLSSESFSGTNAVESITLSGPMLGHKRGPQFVNSTSTNMRNDFGIFGVKDFKFAAFTGKIIDLRDSLSNTFLYDPNSDFFNQDAFVFMPRLRRLDVQSTTNLPNIFDWLSRGSKEDEPIDEPIVARDTSGIRGRFPNMTQNLELASIKISGTGLTHGLYAMDENTSLQLLDVSENKFDQNVPVFDSATLSRLNLSDNKFRSDLLNPFPVFNLPSLTSLNLSKNLELKGGVPDVRKCFNLIELELTETGFTEYVPDTFSGLTNLSYLGFEFPLIPKAHAQQIVLDLYKSYLRNPRTGVIVNFARSEFILGDDSDSQTFKDILNFLEQTAKWVIISGGFDAAGGN